MDWWDRMLKMIGLRHTADPPSEDEGADRELAAARRRLEALDDRVDVVEAGLKKHVRSPHPRAR